MPTWREVRLLVARELGETVSGARPLTPPRTIQTTWASLGDEECAAESAILDRLQATGSP
jgi:hypothetical protein